MAQLTHEQYERLERALIDGTRLIFKRRGKREYVILPLAFRVQNGRELVEARNPTTGHDLIIYLDEVDGIQPVHG